MEKTTNKEKMSRKQSCKGLEKRSKRLVHVKKEGKEERRSKKKSIERVEEK